MIWRRIQQLLILCFIFNDDDPRRVRWWLFGYWATKSFYIYLHKGSKDTTAVGLRIYILRMVNGRQWPFHKKGFFLQIDHRWKERKPQSIKQGVQTNLMKGRFKVYFHHLINFVLLPHGLGSWFPIKRVVL